MTYSYTPVSDPSTGESWFAIHREPAPNPIADVKCEEDARLIVALLNESPGVCRIAVERQRQIRVEGWTPEHDDLHRDSSIAWAAVCYAAPSLVYRKAEGANMVTFSDPWPWEKTWDKRKLHGNVALPNDPLHLNRSERIRQLEKAGALIAAEIDRLLRAEGRAV